MHECISLRPAGLVRATLCSWFQPLYDEKVRVICLLLCALAACAQVTFEGVLDPALYPSSDHLSIPLRPAAPGERARLRDGVWPSENVWAGDVRGAFALVLDRLDGRRVLYVDRDGDFVLTPEEAVTGDTVMLGLYPVRVALAGNAIRQSARAISRGRVQVDGKEVALEYEADRATGLPSALRGVHSLDGESALASGKPPVFARGDRFLSTSSLDAGQRKVVLRAHPASDYPVIDAKPGRLFSDFTFVEPSGRSRKLSDFQGRYVLLDFWASWCPPCRSDFPRLAAAYERFKPQLEIIGMNADTEPAQAASMLADQRPAWTQASAASIRDLLDNRLRLYRYPAYVLLDREGRVLWTLTGELGAARLERVLTEYLKPKRLR